MISEYVVFRLAKNNINFMRLDSTVKLKFYTKLKNAGFSKDKFFRTCFYAFMNDDVEFLKAITKEEYKDLLVTELKAKKEIDKIVAVNNRFTSLRKLNEYDIEYFIDEDKND